MLAVGVALKRWREQHPTLRALGLKCSLVTDADATVAQGDRSILTLRMEAHGTRVVVPFSLTEELKASEGENLGTLVDAVSEAMNEHAYLLDPGAVIHRLTLRGESSDRAAGLAGTAMLEWEGVASW